MFSMRNFEQRKAEIFQRSSGRIKQKKIKISIISISCVFVMILVGVGAQYTIESRNTDPIYQKIIKFPVVEKAPNEVEYTEDISIIPPWDEQSITEQYSELNFNGSIYSGRNKQVSTDMLLDKIGDYTAEGYDEIKWISYTKKAEAYGIKGVSSECAVAVKFEGVDEYYVYTYSRYRPETLGDFIEDLNLKELVSFGDVSYEYDKIFDDTYIDERVVFTDVSDKYIWESLLTNSTLKNVHSDEKNYENTVISISVDIELLGYKNIGLWITEDGYMHTNILDTGKTFYIGKEKIDEITNYLLDNCDGKRYVYTYGIQDEDCTIEFETTVSHEVKIEE